MGGEGRDNKTGARSKGISTGSAAQVVGIPS
jgi:hypothetical protein